MKTQFTPGPWFYQENSDAYTHIVRGRDNYFLCHLPQTDKPYGEANGRLIAAAPELYDSLISVGDKVADLVDQMRFDEWTDSKGHPIAMNVAMLALVRELNSMMVVIKKARGDD